jgi:hypothetical protein
MSDYLQDQIRKHLFRTGTFAKPTVLAIALHTANPGDAGGSEVTGGTYGRVPLNPLDANWSAGTPTDGTTVNLAVIQFAVPTAPWGTVTHVSCWDSVSGGNMLLYATLGAPKVVDIGTDTKFQIGTLAWTAV